MMGCWGHFSALFRSKNESDLLFFHGSRPAIRAVHGGGLLGVCWSCLLRSSSLLFSPQVGLLLDYRGRGGGEKKTNGEENKGPSFEGPGPQLSHMSYSPTMRGEPLWTGTARSQHAEKGSRSLPSRWRVITYILPKMRICSVCHIYTNSDLQGEYRWQVI